ncbi:MAG: histidine phosphatase family protein [Pseudomonadota bacterium]|nr:histidine phosphatase family protein [Pseudomonadota bacterium]
MIALPTNSFRATCRCLLLIAATLALSACLSAPTTQPSKPELSFVVVRHAEKRSDHPRDPSLTDAGRARAQRLASSLQTAPVVAVYSTDYRRTRETATPAADAHGLPVIGYDAELAAVTFARQLRSAHSSGTVLIVAHSNTSPDIAAALCGCEVAAMEESEYGRRMTVRVAADGRVTLDVTRDQ